MAGRELRTGIMQMGMPATFLLIFLYTYSPTTGFNRMTGLLLRHVQGGRRRGRGLAFIELKCEARFLVVMRVVVD